MIVGCWVAALGLIVYSHVRSGDGAFPPAYGFTGAATVYSLAALGAQIPGAAPLFGMFAIAWTASLYWRVTASTAAAPLTAAGRIAAGGH